MAALASVRREAPGAPFYRGRGGVREEIVRAAVATVARRLGRNRREERGSREEWGRLEALGVVRNRTGDAGRLGAAVEELAVAAMVSGSCAREEEGEGGEDGGGATRQRESGGWRVGPGKRERGGRLG